MNERVVIDNRDYHLLETLPLLTGRERFVLCEDSDGNKFVCPEDRWLRHAPKPEVTAPVHSGSAAREKIDFFLSLFRGREDVYAKRYHNLKSGKSGYVPACRDVVGIYPMQENDSTRLLAVDFDEEMWREDVTAFREACLSFGVEDVSGTISGHPRSIAGATQAAFTFEKILREVKAKYVYGLSATPMRQDGHQPIIFMQCGPVRYLVDAKSQAEKREKLSALRAVPANESLAVIATGKYVGEGFDEPRLDTILLTMPISWKGTLAQYVGRLHRNCEGKREVRVYDYVDIHIPMLERMYHKRLKGYAELGYQVKMSGQDAAASQIYGVRDYFLPFTTDLNDAAANILIVSPFLKMERIKAVLATLEKAISAGVSVVACTKLAENYRPEQQAAVERSIELLTGGGITVETHHELQPKYAVLDRSIVWYGSIDYLSYSVKDANALRFENAEIAGELLNLLREEDQPEQMQIEQLI